MKWQKWARLIVATIGIAAAVVVYATMGERAKLLLLVREGERDAARDTRLDSGHAQLPGISID